MSALSAQDHEIYEKTTKSALICLQMALKRLKTREFGRNPDPLPETRKNRKKWKTFTLILGENNSRWTIRLVKVC